MERRHTQDTSTLQRKLDAVTKVWNGRELSHGCKLAVGPNPLKRRQSQWVHPKQWSLDGLIPYAFGL
eukprot:9387938-Pyramimonas_sp.AAC.1